MCMGTFIPLEMQAPVATGNNIMGTDHWTTSPRPCGPSRCPYVVVIGMGMDLRMSINKGKGIGMCMGMGMNKCKGMG